MIANYKSLAYDPDSVYGASKKMTTDRLRRLEFQKINPDVVSQSRLGYNVTDVNYNSGLFEDALVRVLGSLKKIYSYISANLYKRALTNIEYGFGGRRMRGGMPTNTGARVSTETAPGSEGEQILNTLDFIYDVPETLRFDPRINDIDEDSLYYDIPTQITDIRGQPLENPIINALVDVATLLQQANTFFNGKLRKHINMISGDNLTRINSLMLQLKREYDNLYNEDVQRYLNLSNGEELVNDIRNKLNKLQVDVAAATRNPSILLVGSTERGEFTGAGRGFVPLKIHAPFRAIRTKYML
jgi:hypothetical protein